ncbi:hypothetical protein VNO80_07466 [Phaseolus coccineus]|uniref:Non-specific lipid-transfer protein n=1 Tax=Phaseolus coccineus TaxID=3886 RepID=A0AAN9RJX8_PHACN
MLRCITEAHGSFKSGHPPKSTHFNSLKAPSSFSLPLKYINTTPHHFSSPPTLQSNTKPISYTTSLLFYRNILSATMASVKVACVVVMFMAVVSAPMMVQAISCNEVTVQMTPCLSYLMNGGAASAGCCSGVRNILGAAGTTVDKQTVCNCLKNAAGRFNINEKYAQALPGLCNVNVPYKISRSTNCANIRF